MGKGCQEQPLPIAKCLLSVLEPPHDGYRIKACAGLDPVSGTTEFLFPASTAKSSLNYELIPLKLFVSIL